MSGTKIPDGFVKTGGFQKSDGFAKTGRSVKPGEPEKSGSSKLPFQHLREPLTKSPIEAPGKQMMAARELFKQTAAGLGFPQDRLSVALLAFARFFSLPPSEALLASLRREFLALNKTSSSGTAAPTGEEKAALEAKALALVSALDKGVVLGSEALMRYARFLAPEAFKDREAMSPKGHTVKENTALSGGGGKGSKADQEEMPRAEEIRVIAEGQSREDDLLDFLNLLPGKNRQYWMVFPFNIKVQGIELRVFLRVLKRECGSVSSRFSAGESEYLIADIIGPKRRWRCFLNKIADKYRADIQVYPECNPGELKTLAKEAELFLGKGALLSRGLTRGLTGGSTDGFSGFDEIVVRNGDEIPSWMEDLCAEHLPSIDEEV